MNHPECIEMPRAKQRIKLNCPNVHPRNNKGAPRKCNRTPTNLNKALKIYKFKKIARGFLNDGLSLWSRNIGFGSVRSAPRWACEMYRCIYISHGYSQKSYCVYITCFKERQVGCTVHVMVVTYTKAPSPYTAFTLLGTRWSTRDYSYFH